MCGYPFVGTLVKRFGNRAVSAGGAFLALTGTLPLVYRASHGLVIPILGFALFIPRHGSELCWRSFPFGCVFFRPPGRPADGHHCSEHCDAYRRAYAYDGLRNFLGMAIGACADSGCVAGRIYGGVSFALYVPRRSVCRRHATATVGGGN
jgi:hypothetical protein